MIIQQQEQLIMAKRGWLVVGGLLAMIAIGSFSALAQNENATAPETVSFQGKIVWAMIASSTVLEDGRNSEILKDPVLRKIGDRYFLVGTPHQRPDSTPDWRASSEAGVAWESVQQFYVYTPEQFDEVMKNYDPDQNE
jgi:hypothetical protein